MRYQGSKTKFIENFNRITAQLPNERYIEPFVGSGVILFNLTKQYDEYIINDLNEHVISIYLAVKELTFSDYSDMLHEIKAKFGDVKNNKIAYNKLRDYYNENYHFTTKIEKGLYLHVLANICINSMLRFGPNGMNQAHGNRCYFMDYETFNRIKNILNRCKIHNTDYKEFLLEDSVILLDPPYVSRPTSYENNFDILEHDDLLNRIKHLKSNILYTEIYSEKTDKYLKWNHLPTKIITNSAPGAYNDKHQEVCHYNFDIKSTLF